MSRLRVRRKKLTLQQELQQQQLPVQVQLLCCKICGRDESDPNVGKIITKSKLVTTPTCKICWNFQWLKRPENVGKSSLDSKKYRQNNPHYNDELYEKRKWLRKHLPLDRIEKAKKEAKEIAAMQGWGFSGKGTFWPSDDERFYIKVVPEGEEYGRYKNGKKKTVFFHRLVLEHKLGRKIRDGYDAHHINDDPLDNWPSNLKEEKKADHLSLSKTRINRK